MRKVLIPTKLDKVAAALLEEDGFTVIQDPDAGIEGLTRAHPDASALIVRSEKVTAEVIDALPKLQVVVRAGAGYNTIDTKHARRRDVDVMNTPGANSNAVAEEVIALILAAYRHVVEGDITTRAGGWEKKRLMGRELYGKTVGLVGLGNIGQLLAKRLSGFETTVLGYDPVISDERAAALGVELTSLESLFEKADIVSLHVPETDQTRGMIGANLLQRMQPEAMLINCARAGVINEQDLRQAKQDRGLLFCNDVYAADAPGPKSVADVADVMMPHLGASTRESNYNAARRAAEQLIAYFAQGVSKYVVNRGVPEGLDEAYQRLAFYLTKVARAYLGNDAPRHIEASFYGGLSDYADWFLGPIVLGLSAEFDPVFDHQQGARFLEEKGITYLNRDVDECKGYGDSMTIDLFEGCGNTVSKVSVRGTVAEGNPMVSRIDNFEKLYFEPRGHSVLAVYLDRPGVLAKITSVLARHRINIDDIRSPHDASSGDSMAVLKVNQPVDDAVLEEIGAEAGTKKIASVNIR